METHSKHSFQRRRVGGNPLSAKNLGKTSGCQPTRIDYFDLNEWVYPLCKITYNGMNMPYNSIFLHFNWSFAHPIYSFYEKRVGQYPLETLILAKTSGLIPTQGWEFGQDEWVNTHSRLKFSVKWVEQYLLKVSELTPFLIGMKVDSFRSRRHNCRNHGIMNPSITIIKAALPKGRVHWTTAAASAAAQGAAIVV